MDAERFRRPAQIVLAIIAALAAAAAGLRYVGLIGPQSPFGERVVAQPGSGSVGMGPFLQLHGFPDRPLKVYLCAKPGDAIGDCVGLASGKPSDRLRSKPIPREFPTGDEIAPSIYPLRVGPDDRGLYPVRGEFKVVEFRVGPRQPVRSFAGVDPSHIQLGAPNPVATGVACIAPLWLPDGRIGVGSTVFDPATGVTTTLPLGVGAAEIAWSPNGGKLAFITDDHKEIRVADADGQNAVTKVREARGLLNSLTWASDSVRFAFIARDDPAIPILGPGPPTVNIFNTKSGARMQSGPGLAVAWAPGGDVLAIERAGARIELGNPAGGRRTLTQGTSPSWSADGRLIAFVRSGSGWVSLPDGSRAAPVAGNGTCGLSFSPSGATMAVAFSSGSTRSLVLRPISAT